MGQRIPEWLLEGSRRQGWVSGLGKSKNNHLSKVPKKGTGALEKQARVPVTAEGTGRQLQRGSREDRLDVSTSPEMADFREGNSHRVSSLSSGKCGESHYGGCRRKMWDWRVKERGTF